MGCCGQPNMVRGARRPVVGFAARYRWADLEDEGGAHCEGGDACTCPPPEACPTGACGMRRVLPGEMASGALSPRELDDLASNAAAWVRLTGNRGERSAGRVMAIGAANFRHSTLAELVALGDFALMARDGELTDIAATRRRTAEEDIEAGLVVQALDAVASDDPYEHGGAGPIDNQTPAESEEEWEAMSPAEKRAAAEAVARRLETAQGAAADARRDAIVARAVSSSFASFNTYLEGTYRIRVAEINRGADITIETIRSNDRERDRLYRLELARLNPGGAGSGASKLGAVEGLSLLALLWSVAK